MTFSLPSSPAGCSLQLLVQIYSLQALRISNKPVFYDPHTPERQHRRGGSEEYREDEAGAGEGGADIESRYHSLYEQRMNPFDQVSLLAPNSLFVESQLHSMLKHTFSAHRASAFFSSPSAKSSANCRS